MPANSAESAERGMVPNTPGHTQNEGGQTPYGMRGPKVTTFGDVPSGTHISESPPMVHPGERLRELDFTDKVVDRILNSRAASTNIQY